MPEGMVRTLRRECISKAGGARSRAIGIGFSLVLCTLVASPALAQPLLQNGEAYATRFSGTTTVGGETVIDTAGTVGSIVDIRFPLQPPLGQHWINELQRHPVTAGEVGQVFGVALDDADPPDVYLAATSAFGLHLTADRSDWMAGMWGPGGGPGTVYKLNRDTGYTPEIFANITLNGRENTGAALGNVAFDRWNDQLYVSDLETGMIHRLRAADGADLGYYDHGVDGRSNFFDTQIGMQNALNPVAFDPASTPRYADCPSGDYTKDPACWNVADFRRRVWGLGVRRDPVTGQVRLHYAVWGSQSFGNPDWAAAGDDQRNSVWSIGIRPDGEFDRSDVRREFLVFGFFTEPADFQRAGGSHPVADIAFSRCDAPDKMLIAERGGLRNLGLDAENPFAYPHESRVIRYDSLNGAWLPVGRYDVGFYDRKNDGPPYIRANSSGGTDFGYGYTGQWTFDPDQHNRFVWMTGDKLCSPDGMCFDPLTGQYTDSSQVHGLQGTPVDAYGELAPAGAYLPYPAAGEPYPATGPRQSYMIDLDINVDANGNPIPAELIRNDATKIGDVEIHQICPARTAHVPWGSYHWPLGSYHWPPGSGHWPYGSEHLGAPSVHWPPGSIHRPDGSLHLGVPSIHWPPGSVHLGGPSFHWPEGSIHWPPGSIHCPTGSGHWPPGSGHWPPGSAHFGVPSVHWPPGSIHCPPGSGHWPPGSDHWPEGSAHWPPGSVHLGEPSTHWPPGSDQHWPPGSGHWPEGSEHWPEGSEHDDGPSTHWPAGSEHFPEGSNEHWPPRSEHIGTPSEHFPQGSQHCPTGSGHCSASSEHVGEPSRHDPEGSYPVPPELPPTDTVPEHLPVGSQPGTTHTPPGSQPVHSPPGSQTGIHLPIGSRPVHTPPGSQPIHTPPGSQPTHTPPGSQPTHTPPGSQPLHTPPGSRPEIHLPLGSRPVHTPPGSQPLHTPPGSQPGVHLPPGSRPEIHLPLGSKPVHTPPGSTPGTTHTPPGSQAVHTPPGSRPLHTPPGSQPGIHLPPGSKPSIHLPPGSRPSITHTPPGSRPTITHVPPGSKPATTHTPPGSRSEIHLPPGSTQQIAPIRPVFPTAPTQPVVPNLQVPIAPNTFQPTLR